MIQITHMKYIMYNIIILNIIWDFACGFSIIFNIKPFSEAHNFLWINTNTTIKERHLFAYLIILWGSMRLLGLIYDIKELIIFSYIYEGLIIMNEVIIYKSMKYEYGIIMSFISFLFGYLTYLYIKK